LIDAGVSPEQLLQEFFSKLSLEDLQTMRAILRKYSSDVAELAEPDEIPIARTGHPPVLVIRRDRLCRRQRRPQFPMPDLGLYSGTQSVRVAAVA
jgi:hypothetical protein